MILDSGKESYLTSMIDRFGRVEPVILWQSIGDSNVEVDGETQMLYVHYSPKASSI